MSTPFSRIANALKAGRELGWRTIRWYALYQLGLRTGHYRRDSLRRTRQPSLPAAAYRLGDAIRLPRPERLLEVMGEGGKDRLLSEAAEIKAGRVHIFGVYETILNFEAMPAARHWTQPRLAGDDVDVKLAWEPARFGWVFPLGRAYRIKNDDGCARAFWEHFEAFDRANPPEMGVHWESAQEVALRLIAFVFAGQVFKLSTETTPARLEQLGRAVAAHAGRIPATMPYARAQGNNHVLTEAAGLYTAGCALPDHPQAAGWRELGMRTFEQGVLDQFTPQGEYSQHSTNYHRLALQTALWMSAMAGGRGETLTTSVSARLGAGTKWLLTLVDGSGGQVPNLGPNDGAYLFPLSSLPYADFRPALQAAACTFLGVRAFEAGKWDEMSLWLGGSDERAAVSPEQKAGSPAESCGPAPHRLDSADRHAWAYLRAARFHTRPGHADQLHLDLWYRGENIAPDAGTYSYNAPAPWDNPLASAFFHNTLTVDGRDQMRRAGKFLWLDWAQARVLGCRRAEDGTLVMLEAQHDGYRRLGLIHRRKIEAAEHGWVVEDRILPARRKLDGQQHTARLHWLLRDYPWQVDADPSSGLIELVVSAPAGSVQLQVSALGPLGSWRLARAGARLAGESAAGPADGYWSPTYAVKLPALSLSVDTGGLLPLGFTSVWRFDR